MKKRTTKLFFAMLVCMAGINLKAMAQDVPAPKGKWTFENASALLEASEGSIQLQPAILGKASATLCETPEEAGITAVDGPTAENKAILVPKDAALWVALNVESASNNYTIQLDFMVKDASPYDALFQTDILNGNDADIFVHSHTVGDGDLGYAGIIVNKRWYRMIMVNNGGTFSLYIDGELLSTNNESLDRWQIAPEGFYLCCDEDGEATDTYVSEVAYWDAPLTSDQIAAYGNFEQDNIPGSNLTKDENGFYLIGSAEELVAFSDLVSSGDTKVNAKLTADIDMGGKLVDGAPAEVSPDFYPIGSTAAPYQGVFDGQDHIIKNLVINRNESYVGMFGRITLEAVIKNFVIDSNSYIGGASCVGIIGATINGASTVLIDRLGMEGAVVASGINAGGILGCNMDSPASTLTNCYVTGPVKGNDQAGQINGWFANGRIENCWAIGTIEGVYNEDAFYRGIPAIAKNNYSNAPDRNDGVEEFNDVDAMSGKMTFTLNGDQNKINWYQTIGEDDLPTLNPNHKVVYPNGHLSCGGEPIGDVSYSNDQGGTLMKDDHLLRAGVCTICGFVDVNYCQKDEEGYFLIDNADELVWFAFMANSGIKGLAGRLTSDINMSSVNKIFPMIGTSASRFNSGKFDGQGHVISGLNIDRSTEDNVGLFGGIMGDCDIRNFVLDSTCSIIGGYYTAIIGSTASVTGTVYISEVGNEGYVKGTRSTGAIFGCELGGTATVYIDRCYSTGIIIGDYESGALTGYISKGHIYDSWSSASITGYYDYDNANKPFALCYCDTRNNYIVHTDLNANFDIKGITAKQVVSGELCYLLNQNSGEEDPIWYQTLDEDTHPVLDNTHGVVVVDEEGKFINTPESITIKGDVNRDGKISIGDLSALVEILQGRDNVKPYRYNHSAADIDEDGSITLADLTALKDIILER